MRTPEKFRFTLQWGAETAEKVQAGSFLQNLGNRKSEFVVLAVTEYFTAHPDVLLAGHKPKIVVKPSYTREQVEALVRSIVEERMAGPPPSQRVPGSHDDEPDTAEPDLDEMLRNLELF